MMRAERGHKQNPSKGSLILFLFVLSWRLFPIQAFLCSSTLRASFSMLTVFVLEQEGDGHSLTVQYEGSSLDITVQPGESILSAMERQSLHHKLNINDVPSDCRRGNCMTCAARCRDRSSLVQDDDGLSPYVSSTIQAQDYILTCQSYVKESGAIIELNENHNLWKMVYQERFPYEKAARYSMAKAIRKSAEKNVEKWKEQTRVALQQTKDP